MELLDTDDPVKGKLLQKSAQHREQLQDEVKLISERTEKILTNALIVGAALAATYFLVSRFSGSSKAKKKGKVARIKLVQSEKASNEEVPTLVEGSTGSGIVSQIGTALASQATVLLLTFAKEKLSEYLQSQREKKAENQNERS